MYQEAVHAGETVYLSKHTGPDQAGAFDNTSILSPYPALEQLQQKRLAARRHKTTFAYDFPHVFGNALRKVWIDRDASGEYDGPQPGLLLCITWCCLMVHAHCCPHVCQLVYCCCCQYVIQNTHQNMLAAFTCCETGNAACICPILTGDNSADGPCLVKSQQKPEKVFDTSTVFLWY